MQLTYHTKQFTDAFSRAAAVSPKRSPKPILQHVLVVCDTNCVTLSATDGDISVRVELDAPESSPTPGACLLPPDRVGQILRELRPENPVTIERREHVVVIEQGLSHFELQTADPDEFPSVKPFDAGDGALLLPALDLSRAIRRTVFATDLESTRYALGGILLDTSEGGVLTLVATDSRRLAAAKAFVTAGDLSNIKTPPIIPVRAAKMLEQAADGHDEVEAVFGSNEAAFRVGNLTLHTRLVEGRFPLYKDVIPSSHDAEIHLAAAPLLAAIRQATIFTNDESRGVDFRFSAGELQLDTNTADVGQSRVRLPVEFQGELVTRLDPRFVTDFLKVVGPDAMVFLRATDGESAILFEADYGYRYVVMPLERDAP